MPKRLTDKSIRAIPVPKDGRTQVYDGIVPGLAVRVTPEGRRTFSVLLRVHGEQKRLTLEPPFWSRGKMLATDKPRMGIAEARQKAEDALRRASEGADPCAEKKAIRGGLARVDTTSAALDDFLKRHVATLRPRSQAEVKRHIESILRPAWGHKPISAIGKADIIAITDSILDVGAAVKANRAFSTLRGFFNWAVGRGLLQVSPCTGLKKPSEESERDRILTPDEIKKLWQVWDALPYPGGAFLKTLLLTGQRRTETARMKWSDVDLDAGVWRIPRDDTKADRTHMVPLSPEAVAILSALPRFEDDTETEDESGVDYVFTTTGGKRPIGAFNDIKAASDKKSKITDWRLHDLRRTAGSGLETMGLDPYVVGACLNHSLKRKLGATSIYMKGGDLFAKQKRAALEAWGRKVAAIVAGKSDNVVALHA